MFKERSWWKVHTLAPEVLAERVRARGCAGELATQGGLRAGRRGDGDDGEERGEVHVGLGMCSVDWRPAFISPVVGLLESLFDGSVDRRGWVHVGETYIRVRMATNPLRRADFPFDISTLHTILWWGKLMPLRRRSYSQCSQSAADDALWQHSEEMNLLLTLWKIS